MAYSLELLPAVREFLFSCPELSRMDRVRLFENLNSVRDHGDQYREDATRRLSPDSEHFSFDIILRTESGAFRQFRFVVSDASAAFGLLRVVYADEM